MNIQKIMSSLEAKHPGESEYLQAVKEVLLSIEDIYNQHPEFEKLNHRKIGRTRPYLHFPCDVGGRQRRGADQPRLSCTIQ